MFSANLNSANFLLTLHSAEYQEILKKLHSAGFFFGLLYARIEPCIVGLILPFWKLTSYHTLIFRENSFFFRENELPIYYYFFAGESWNLWPLDGIKSPIPVSKMLPQIFHSTAFIHECQVFTKRLVLNRQHHKQQNIYRCIRNFYKARQLLRPEMTKSLSS